MRHVLMPHPAILRKLVEEYEALAAEGAEDARSGTSGRAQDLAYTLCVSTGTREVGQALAVARRQLAAAYAPLPTPPPLRTTVAAEAGRASAGT
ncbi:DUF5133 domain-containing protein [Streptomyces cavernae]|uniref:DUF5133 domain-containing protein n=1 Tax=Streptomyces cavernae TaxID=2259034 RepID=UPI001EE48D12|nr:DUF5133 domain-containing protein [Streptomyces cavernae]